MDDEDFGEFGFASKKISAKGAFGRDQVYQVADNSENTENFRNILQSSCS